jgi:hypothetical protein
VGQGRGASDWIFDLYCRVKDATVDALRRLLRLFATVTPAEVRQIVVLARKGWRPYVRALY